MPLLLHRHATAGHRVDGEDDRLRPLDERGHRQAQALPGQYESFDVERVLTSPYVRCRESVAPLAKARGLPVEERAELAEGTAEEETRALLDEVAGTTAVLSTHGDILEELLGEEPEKGSTWVVEVDGDGGLRRHAYLPPPA
jgi:8-oxo-dGTP diphosphatase